MVLTGLAGLSISAPEGGFVAPHLAVVGGLLKVPRDILVSMHACVIPSDGNLLRVSIRGKFLPSDADAHADKNEDGHDNSLAYRQYPPHADPSTTGCVSTRYVSTVPMNSDPWAAKRRNSLES